MNRSNSSSSSSSSNGDSGAVRRHTRFANRARMILRAASAVAVLTVGVFSQEMDTAYVPVKVLGVNAVVSIQPPAGVEGAAGVTKNLTANRLDTLAIVLGPSEGVSVSHQAQMRSNAAVAISQSRGNVSLKLAPAQYGNATVSLYSINGRRILVGKADAAKANRSVISRNNVAAGVYLLQIKGAKGNSHAAKLTHSGGKLNVNVAFAGETAARTAKANAEDYGQWIINVKAGYYDSSYTFAPVKGENPTQNIETYNGASVAAPVAASGDSNSVVVLDSWSNGVVNVHVIYVGHISNAMIKTSDIVEWQGIAERSYTYTESTSSSVEIIRSATVSSNVAVSAGGSSTEGGSESSTNSLETVHREQTTKGGSAGGSFMGIGASASFEKVVENITTEYEENTMEVNWSETKTFNTTEERGREESNSVAESYISSISVSNTITLKPGVSPAGYYRLVWYDVSDVYMIALTSLDNQILHDFRNVSCVRRGINNVPIIKDDYSPSGYFNNAPKDNLIVLPHEFWKTLPIPRKLTTKTDKGTVVGHANHTVPDSLLVTLTRVPNKEFFFDGDMVNVIAEVNDNWPNYDVWFHGWAGEGAGVPTSSTTAPFMAVTFDGSDVTLTAHVRAASKGQMPFNKNIQYETLTDERDGRLYRTVQMPDGKWWMAENLNYSGHIIYPVGLPSGFWCYENSVDSCYKYGRLYSWEAATTIYPPGLIIFDPSPTPTNIRGICPAGWHLPSEEEWTVLTNAIPGGASKAGTELKSSSYWQEGPSYLIPAGKNTYGFSALPGGIRDLDGSFGSARQTGGWWTATEGDADGAYGLVGMHYFDEIVDSGIIDNKNYGLSVRCVRND